MDDPTLKRWSDLLDDATVVPGRTGASAGTPALRDRYRILKHLGTGGMGTVYLVRDESLQRDAAMKVCDARTLDPAMEKQFVVEAQLAAQLEHPNILPVYDMGVDPNRRYFFIMRYIEGQSLAQILDREPPPWTRRLEIFLQICNAIRYAHSRSVLHRDIKPQNVLVGPFGETFVIDWGISKIVSPPAGAVKFTAGALQTISSGLVGTPAYMPPEVLLNVGAPVDGRIDVYALGVVLWNLLGGKTPFHAETLQELVEAKLDLRLSPLPPEAPREFVGIARKAMAPSPANRYASVEDLVTDVQAAQESRPGTAWRDPLTVLLRKWLRRHPTFTAVLCTALLAYGAYHLHRYLTLVYDQRFQTVYVVTKPGDAWIEISRNGRTVYQGITPTPTSEPLERGRYHIVVTRDGFQDFAADFDVPGGPDFVRLEYQLVPDVGRLEIHPADPSISVILEGNGARIERAANASPFELNAGRYAVTLVKDGVRMKRDVLILFGSTTRVAADFPDWRLWSHGSGWWTEATVACAPALADDRLILGVARRETTGMRTWLVVFHPSTGAFLGVLNRHISGKVSRMIARPGRIVAIAEDDVYVVPIEIGETTTAAESMVSGGREAILGADLSGDTLVVLTSKAVLAIDLTTRARTPIREFENSFPFGHVEGGFWIHPDLEEKTFAGVVGAWERTYTGRSVSNVLPVDGNWVFVLGQQLTAVSGRDGSILWQRPLSSSDWELLPGLFLVNAGTIRGENWTREYRIKPGGQHAAIEVAASDLTGDGVPEVAILDREENRLRIFDGATSELIYFVHREFGFLTAGRSSFFLGTPNRVECVGPGRAIRFDTRTAGDAASVLGFAASGDETFVISGSQALRMRIADSEILDIVALPQGRRRIRFTPSHLLIETATGVRARLRRDSREFEIPGANSIDAIGALGDDLVVVGPDVRLISGGTGETLWTRKDVKFQYAVEDLLNVMHFDADGDGRTDLWVRNEGRTMHFLSGATGTPFLHELPPDGYAFLYHGRDVLYWSERWLRIGDRRIEVNNVRTVYEVGDLNGDGVREIAVCGQAGAQIRDGAAIEKVVAQGGSMWVETSRRIAALASQSELDVVDVETGKSWRRTFPPCESVRVAMSESASVAAVLTLTRKPEPHLAIYLFDLRSGEPIHAQSLPYEGLKADEWPELRFASGFVVAEWGRFVYRVRAR